ncbi:DMT family transporter [Ramlibacter rhizophilus]|uniref:DMT family transporter n=1 Tax=Ramlibacter rhizophilus TaxID=1781167 RepID=A0A4Z0C2I4_9BURK|nr:DMT family transporter [Ramlibacter rhizophilus]TFZ05054.1 DMT family transporter [Ramlibacter rhizophilus]
MSSHAPRLAAYACLASSMALVGSYVALSKPLVAVFPVMLLAWLRFGIGGAAMVHWLRKPAEEPHLDRRTHGLLFLESFLGNFLFTVCMLWGVSMTSAVSAGVIMAAIPAAVAVMSRVFLGERIGSRTLAAIGCAVAAVAVLALSPDDTAPDADRQRAWLGNLLVFGAVLCEAAYAVIGKALTQRVGPRRITAVINLWGFALVTPFGVVAARSFDFTAVPPSLWALLVFYALAASVWSVWLWMTGLRQVPAARAGVFTVMLPLSAAAVGVLALSEPWGVVQLAALGLGLAGVLLATLGPAERSAAARRGEHG